MIRATIVQDDGSRRRVADALAPPVTLRPR